MWRVFSEFCGFGEIGELAVWKSFGELFLRCGADSTFYPFPPVFLFGVEDVT